MHNQAPEPALGHVAAGFEPVADLFARQLRDGHEIGASFAVYQGEELIINLWGGLADVQHQRPWHHDTRLVVFSVTKGFAAMAFHLLADRGQLDWQAPVAQYWPGFGKNGKEDMTVATLLGHRGGLAYLDKKFTLADFCDPVRAADILEALENQPPAWTPGTSQGYHALTFGMYASELFARIAFEPMGEFLRRELFEPLESDVYLGTPAPEDPAFATLYPPPTTTRVSQMVKAAITAPKAPEAFVFRSFLDRSSTMRRAFTNPSVPRNDLRAYNRPPVRRTELAWASATGSARGVARAYLPFANGGTANGRKFLKPETLAPVYERQGWSEHDLVLHKPLGWTHGFLKEETSMFSPNPESFGHAGMGGALGWADPIHHLSIGYVMNRMDWRVRSPRALALCHAVYDCLKS